MNIEDLRAYVLSKQSVEETLPFGPDTLVYKVNGNSANMSLENMPGGIYFVRLVNSAGNIVATKKFTKQ